MDIGELVRSLGNGDLLTARQLVADWQRLAVQWQTVPQPNDLSDTQMVIAAAVVELLAERSGAPSPTWTRDIPALKEPLILDPGLEQMPRSLARAKAHGPEPLRKRNLVALPDFLAVA